MNKAEKNEEVKFLTDRFKTAQLALCADYRGLTVSKVTTLRKNLRGVGASARVVKNKLAKLAVSNDFGAGSETDKFLGLFKGPSFVVFSDVDPVAPAKVLADFVKGNNQLQIKGAWVDGRCLDLAGVEALAKMPGKKELLAQLLSLINAPATQLVGLLAAPASQVVRVIDAQRKKLEEGGAAA